MHTIFWPFWYQRLSETWAVISRRRLSAAVMPGLKVLLKRPQLYEPWQLIPSAVKHEEARAVKAREDTT
jgi:hypothetical protein